MSGGRLYKENDCSYRRETDPGVCKAVRIRSATPLNPPLPIEEGLPIEEVHVMATLWNQVDFMQRLELLYYGLRLVQQSPPDPDLRLEVQSHALKLFEELTAELQLAFAIAVGQSPGKSKMKPDECTINSTFFYALRPYWQYHDSYDEGKELCLELGGSVVGKKPSAKQTRGTPFSLACQFP